jgi:serine/threonine-protein kinase
MSTTDPPPSSFAGYEVLQLVGKGGKGVVYRARHPLLQIVALKLLAAGPFAPGTDLQRFLREARVLASLEHPNIVPIYQVGEDQGQPYLTMKFVESNLARWLTKAAPPLREVVQVLSRVARAVHFAHEHGILHRNLKPTSILLDADLTPSLASFGLARTLGGPGVSLTTPGPIIGTPAYIAPEQGSGRMDLTPAADVWSLGVILYEAITGQLPFRGDDSLATLLQVLEKEPEAPRTINRAIKPDLESIVLKCLQKAPDRRYASAAALADDLERYLSGAPVVGHRGPLTRLWQWWSGQQP